MHFSSLAPSHTCLKLCLIFCLWAFVSDAYAGDPIKEVQYRTYGKKFEFADEKDMYRHTFNVPES